MTSMCQPMNTVVAGAALAGLTALQVCLRGACPGEMLVIIAPAVANGSKQHGWAYRLSHHLERLIEQVVLGDNSP